MHGARVSAPTACPNQHQQYSYCLQLLSLKSTWVYEHKLWHMLTNQTHVDAPFAAEIIMFDDYIVVYKYLGDLMFYVTGAQSENELILYSVLQAFYESVTILLR